MFELTVTPRTCSMSPRVTGCLYAISAKRFEQRARITRRPVFPQPCHPRRKILAHLVTGNPTRRV